MISLEVNFSFYNQTAPAISITFEGQVLFLGKNPRTLPLRIRNKSLYFSTVEMEIDLMYQAWSFKMS